MQWKAYCVQSTLGLPAQFCNLGVTMDISPCLFKPKWRDSREGAPQLLGLAVVSWASEMFPRMTVRMQRVCIRSSSDRTQSLNSRPTVCSDPHLMVNTVEGLMDGSGLSRSVSGSGPAICCRV